MNIVDFEELKVGDDLLIISDYQRNQEVCKIAKISAWKLELVGGRELSLYDLDRGCIAIKADHPEVQRVRDDYIIKSVAGVLNFSKSIILENPKIREKLLEIKEIMGDDFNDKYKILKSLSAIGSETSDLGDMIEKLYKKSKKKV